MGRNMFPGMPGRQFSRRVILGRAASAGAGLAGATYLSRLSVVATKLGVAMSSAAETPQNSPTVVLVQGAFADDSGWAGVIAALAAEEARLIDMIA